MVPTPSSPPSSSPINGPALRFKPRVFELIVSLTALICASVILTDIYSHRDRHPAESASTLPNATGAAP